MTPDPVTLSHVALGALAIAVLALLCVALGIQWREPK